MKRQQQTGDKKISFNMKAQPEDAGAVALMLNFKPIDVILIFMSFPAIIFPIITMIMMVASETGKQCFDFCENVSPYRGDSRNYDG